MYLAPDYSTDIFISYSHGDIDQVGKSELKIWSQEFAQELEAELRDELKDVAMFLDDSKRVENALDPTFGLTEQIRATAQGAGLLIVLMSPHYLRSAWCRDEREWWLSHHSERGVRGRIFVARIWPTDEQEWPKEFRDERGHAMVGFWFHRREHNGSAVRPFGWRGNTADTNERVQQVLNLVGAVALRLREFKGQLDARRRAQQDADRLAEDRGQTLYLYAREEHREAWSRAYDALDRLGYVVVPAAPEPSPDTSERMHEIGQERVKQLVACDALLLLGTEDGFKLDGDMVNVGRHSRERARALSGKLLPCAVLATRIDSISTAQRLILARRLAIRWIDFSSAGPHAVHDWLLNATAHLDDTV